MHKAGDPIDRSVWETQPNLDLLQPNSKVQQEATSTPAAKSPQPSNTLFKKAFSSI